MPLRNPHSPPCFPSLNLFHFSSLSVTFFWTYVGLLSLDVVSVRSLLLLLFASRTYIFAALWWFVFIRTFSTVINYIHIHTHSYIHVIFFFVCPRVSVHVVCFRWLLIFACWTNVFTCIAFFLFFVSMLWIAPAAVDVVVVIFIIFSSSPRLSLYLLAIARSHFRPLFIFIFNMISLSPFFVSDLFLPIFICSVYYLKLTHTQARRWGHGQKNQFNRAIFIWVSIQFLPVVLFVCI